MLNVNDLEIRHKKYKQKLRMPYIILFTSLSIIILSIIFFYNNKYFIKKNILITKEPVSIQKNNETKKIDINKTQKIVTNVSKPKKTTDENEKKEIVIEDEKLILSPSLNFLKKMQSNIPLYYEVNNNIEKKSIIKKQQPIEKEKIVVIKSDLEVQEKVVIIKKPNVKIKINIERKDTYDDIHHVIKRFKTNNSPALSLFIAKKYYQLQEYDKSYNYALITNKINNNIEASWIIFSKSLIKLNKKDMAIKTLQKYINYSHSSKASLLLDEIISGKFK